MDNNYLLFKAWSRVDREAEYRPVVCFLGVVSVSGF